MQLDAGGKQYWIWNVMDRSTGYLLASPPDQRAGCQVSSGRVEESGCGCGRASQDGQTDRWPYYVLAVKQIFPDARHLRLVGVGNPEDIKSPSKRVQDLFKQRTRTLRGVGSQEKGQFYLDGWTLDYNFFRDHESMNGNPSGQAAKVNPPFNEWADVVKDEPTPKARVQRSVPGATSVRIEMPAGSDVAREVDSDNRPPRPRVRRKRRPAVKPKSGIKPRSPGAQGRKSGATAPLKLGTYARQVRKG